MVGKRDSRLKNVDGKAGFVKDNNGQIVKQLVGCGKCVPCRRKRQMEWSFRLKQEYKDSTNAVFLTLTYDEVNVPEIEGLLTLKKKDLQDFNKVLKTRTDRYWKKNGFKLFEEDKYTIDVDNIKDDFMLELEMRQKGLKYIHQSPIKQYCVGEYGTKTQRPHYHGIYFNVPKKIVKQAGEIWNKGHVHVGNVTEASILYVASYVMQGNDTGDQRENEFAIMSKGLGKGYIQRNGLYHKILRTKELDNGDRKYNIPRYLSEKIFDDDEHKEIGEKNAKKAYEEYQKETDQLLQKGIDPFKYRNEQKQNQIRKYLKSKKGKL